MIAADGRIRSFLMVIPGQSSDRRRDAEDLAFGPSSNTTGVIHVVCWGRNKIWEQGGRDTIKDQVRGSGARLDQARLFEINKSEELKYFRRTCTLLKDAWRNQKDVWLIIAVTKCDLFSDDLSDARDYYIPTSADFGIAAATAKAKKARETADRNPTSGQLRQKRLTAEAEVERLSDKSRTAFADELDDLVRTLGWTRFRNLAVLPVSSVLDTYTFDGSVAEVEPRLDELGKDALSRYFLERVGEFCGI